MSNHVHSQNNTILSQKLTKCIYYQTLIETLNCKPPVCNEVSSLQVAREYERSICTTNLDHHFARCCYAMLQR